MRHRAVVLILAAALLGSGCNSQLGREEPGCDTDTIGTTLILSAQSVRGAAYVPCIHDLKPGWTYEHLVARSGQSRFWISSDRVGVRFLEVTFEGWCDLGGALAEDSDEDHIPLFVDVRREDFHIRMTVVPEGNDETHIEYAAELVAEISATRVEDRLVEARVDSADLPTTERIRSALGQGRIEGDLLAVGAISAFAVNVTLWRRYPASTGPSPSASAA